MPLKTERELVDNNLNHTNGICREISTDDFKWSENITVIDLSNRKINKMEDNVTLPKCLIELNISHNNIKELPRAILDLKTLKYLDASHNEITFFDEAPKCCHSIEKLNMSHNALLSPPYWIWSQSPQTLTEIDLSYNLKICESLDEFYFNELLKYKSQVTYVKISNCRLQRHLKLLDTFYKVKHLEIGTDNLSLHSANNANDVPFDGIHKCCDIERLKLSNIKIYSVNPTINIFTKLVEIDLSFNYLSSLPLEFCNLHNLKCCILSANQLLYLPEDIGKLENLEYLKINNNELCMLPDSIIQLRNLRLLDLYDNSLYEVPIEIYDVSELDLAQNYFEEPSEAEYIGRREKLRLSMAGRYNGMKEIREDLSQSYSMSNEDLQSESSSNHNELGRRSSLSSSSEDWDSDDFWVPCFTKRSTPPSQPPWLFFIKKKMEEGNFCPMDAHTTVVSEKVKYEKQCRPDIPHESDGQFDDFSGDDS
ncbi:hypothetical protein ACJJTC_003902 [Scirpophaga incertulas]